MLACNALMGPCERPTQLLIPTPREVLRLTPQTKSTAAKSDARTAMARHRRLASMSSTRQQRARPRAVVTCTFFLLYLQLCGASPLPLPLRGALQNVSCSFAGVLCESSLAAACYGRCDLSQGGAIYFINHIDGAQAGDWLDVVVRQHQPYLHHQRALAAAPAWARERLGYTVESVVRRHSGQRRQLAVLGTIFGSRSVLTICMQYPGSAQACSESELNAQLWGGGSVSLSVADILNQSSYGQLTLSAQRSRFVVVDMTGALAPQYTLGDMSCTTAQVDQPAVARSRLPADVVLSDYDHIEYILPSEVQGACSWCGLAATAGKDMWILCANVHTRMHGASIAHDLATSTLSPHPACFDSSCSLERLPMGPPRRRRVWAQFRPWAYWDVLDPSWLRTLHAASAERVWRHQQCDGKLPQSCELRCT